MDTDPIVKAREPFANAREAYDAGMPLHLIKLLFHMSDGELREMAPDEFPDESEGPEGNLGGY